MNSLPPIISFRHPELTDSTTQFRLLQILQCRPAEPIICDLSAFALLTAPAYFAISYTWGDPRLTASVLVNGTQMTVRQNCDYALRQAFNSNASRYFWIDSICIDQTSTQEKNHQVAMMGRIYQRAAHVFACVGPHQNDSEHLLNVLDASMSLSVALHSALRIAEVDPATWGIGNPIPRNRSLARTCYFAMNSAKRKRLADAFIAFLERPYFSRVWILQEMLLAKSITYCCGMDIGSFNDITAISMLVDFWINENLHSGHYSSAVRKMMAFMSRRRHLLRRQKALQNMQSQTEDISFS